MQNEFSNNLQIIPMNKNIVNNIKRAQVGTELWQYILYFLVLLIMIEMFISNPLKKL